MAARAERRVRQGVTGYLQSRAKMLRGGFMVLAAAALAGCASGGTGESYQRLQISVVSTLTQAGSGTYLETLVQASARPPGTSTDPVNCASTGRLEHEIGRRVALAVGG